MSDPSTPAPGGDSSADVPAPGFAEAMAELQRIVAELESDTLDVDQLTARVERAATLVAWCRDRIDGTRFAVSEILERLEDEGVDRGRGGPGAVGDAG